MEPIGWANPAAIADRRCTLDCQGCHISPTGGGQRTPLGQFYAAEVLAMHGTRPSSAADLTSRLPAGAPNRGKYRLLDGFEGWWPGATPHREIADRYGDIDPEPVFAVGGDLRVMIVEPLEAQSQRESAVFPMEAQLYLSWYLSQSAVAYVDVGWQGSRTGLAPEGNPDALTLLQDRLWLREVFFLFRDLPYATYVRVGRFALPYGWRIPDHTVYVRKDKFDVFRQAYGVEVGFSPNEYWANLALYWQGLHAWPGELDTTRRGPGITAQGGIRYLGFTLGVSLHGMGIVSPGSHGIDESEFMAGPLWALNLHPLVYLGEFDYRADRRAGGRVASLFQYHELRWQGLRSFTPKLRYEWADANIAVLDDHLNRVAVGMEWNPLAQVQLDVLFRHEFRPVQGDLQDLLVQLHAHF